MVYCSSKRRWRGARARRGYGQCIGASLCHLFGSGSLRIDAIRHTTSSRLDVSVADSCVFADIVGADSYVCMRVGIVQH
jgi:hypothetical protein